MASPTWTVPSGVSTKSIDPGSPAMSVGKNGGRRKVWNAAARDPSDGWGGPWMVSRAPSNSAGAKKGSPCTWSQCMWVTKAAPAKSAAAPSRMTSSP